MGSPRVLFTSTCDRGMAIRRIWKKEGRGWGEKSESKGWGARSKVKVDAGDRTGGFLG